MTPATLSVSQLRHQKLLLVDAIRAAIAQFEKATGLLPTAIDYELLGGSSYSDIEAGVVERAVGDIRVRVEV